MKKKIAFFYPSRNVGGAQLLFARLAEFLLNRGEPVVIIDYEGGFISSYLENEGLKPELILYKEELINIEFDICLIQHLSSIITIQSILNLTDKSTFVFWSIHPHNIFALFKFTPFYTRSSYQTSNVISSILEPRRKNKIIRLLNELSTKNSIYFMDGANYLPSKNLKLIDKKDYFIPIPIIDKFYTKKRIDFSVANIAWIGRVTDEKIHAFNHIVKQLDLVSEKFNIVFHIIGYGQLSALESVKNLKFVDHRIVEKNYLDRLLIDHVDGVFGMGTSILEAAVLSIPSILTDVSKFSFSKNYKYKWLFETTEYSLGTNARDSDGTVSIYDIMQIMFDEKKYAEVGRKCSEYAKNNHSIKEVVSKLMEAKKSSTFTNFDLRKLW